MRSNAAMRQIAGSKILGAEPSLDKIKALPCTFALFYKPDAYKNDKD